MHHGFLIVSIYDSVGITILISSDLGAFKARVFKSCCIFNGIVAFVTELFAAYLWAELWGSMHYPVTYQNRIMDKMSLYHLANFAH